MSRAQEAKLHSIFRGLRPEYGRDEVDADKITDIFSKTDGQRRRLVGLDNVEYFKSNAAKYAHSGDVGDAEEVFKEVAKVICGLGSPPHDWRAVRLPISQEQQPYEDFDHSPYDISEVFTWTHNGIKYEVSSDVGDDYWYFRGTAAVHDRPYTSRGIITAVHDRRFFRDVEIRGGGALRFVIHDGDSPYLRDISPEYIEAMVREEKESLIEALEETGEEGRINDIQARKYSLMRLFRDKYMRAPEYPKCYRIVDCIRNARDEIITMRGIGLEWHRDVILDIKAKHWHELDHVDQYAMSMGRSRSGSEGLHNMVFLVCEDSHHDGDNIVSSEVESFWEKMNLRFSCDDDYGRPRNLGLFLDH